MLERDITQARLDRHAETQEDFTPECVIDMMLPGSDDDPLYTDFTKTFCDPCAGIGNIYMRVLEKRLTHCKSNEDIELAVSSMYTVELMQDNVDEMKQRILSVLPDTRKIRETIEHNVICSDFFKWDFENWKPIVELTDTALF